MDNLLAGAHAQPLRAFERPGEDFNQMVTGDEAKQGADSYGHQTLDEHPSKILKMLQEGLHRATFLDLLKMWMVQVDSIAMDQS